MLARAASALALSSLLLAPSLAHADRRELYTSAEISPQLFHLTDPIAEKATTTLLAPGVALSVAYGLTNALHVGGALHFSMGTNASFNPSQVILSDGSPSDGVTYEDLVAVGATAFALYRFDTGTRLAPLLQADLGLTSISYTKVAHIPTGSSFAIGFPDVSETVLELRASARAEYRFSDHLVASGGIGAIVNPGALRSWALYLPFTFGWIW